MDPNHTQVPTTSTSDSSQYIRTYAKDFAALSGKDGINESTSKKEKPKRSRLSRREEESVSLVTENQQKKPIDLSILERQAETIDAKTEAENVAAFGIPKIEQTFELSAIEDGDLVQGNVAPPAPTELEQAMVAPTPQPVADERTEILNRLSAKAKQVPVIPRASTKPEFIPQAPEPIRPVQPSSLPTIARQPEPIQVAAPLPSQAQSTVAPDALHTYKSDFADKIDSSGANTFAVLAAEKDAPRVRTRSTRKTSLLPILIGIILVLVGGGAAFTGYQYLQSHKSVSILPTRTALLSSDSEVTLTANSGSVLQEFAAEAAKPITQNSIVEVRIATSSATASKDTILTQLEIPAPDILLRNTEPSSMAGVIHAGDQTRPFFILRVTSYERTFAGMLQWEDQLPKDLAVLYPAYPSQPITSSSTSPTDNTISGFTDEVVANHNVRTAQDGSGKSVIVYGYADSQTLIIARDEAAFQMLLNRLQSSGN